MEVQVLGVCRFSLLVTGGFQKMPEDMDGRRAALYDPARLATRLLWFEHVFVPSIRCQTDPDFTLFIVTGEDLPAKCLDRLRALIADVPQLELLQMPPMPHGDACREILRARMDPGTDVVVQFRLDDDDAVARNYVRRLRRDFRTRLRLLYRQQPLLGLDYCRGFVLRGVEGEVLLRTVTENLWTPALSIYMPPDHDKSVFDYPHHLLFRRMATVSLQDSIMFVRGVHDSNDSGIRDRSMSAPLEPARARDRIAQRFGINLDHFETALKAASTSRVGTQ